MDSKWKGELPAAGLFVVAICLGLIGRNNKPETVTAGVQREEPAKTEVVLGAKIAETGTGITVTKADDWSSEFANEYETFMQNNENDEVVDYLEQSPYLKTLYEGYGFAISYGSARGHTYDIDDLYATGRPHKLANCFTCKTSDFTAKVLNEGDSAYAMAFDDFKSEVQDPFGCFHCHENTPGEMYVTHGYLADALGDDLNTVPAADLSCAQCHTEYYFDPETKATTLGYHGLDTMNPEDILAYENSVKDTEGNQFADWVDESTGTRKLKAQHPEFETYYGEGSIHKSFDLTCADCHMAKETAADGTTYTSHYWISPLQSDTIMNSTCAQCHSDLDALKAKVKEIQDETTTRETEIGEKLVQLDGKLTDAVNNGTMSDEDLDTVRSLYRDAQFYWDFVFVENSEGVHNSALTKETLDKAEELVDQALAKF
jgi:nitrite reductase (cytochrome c-552)